MFIAVYSNRFCQFSILTGQKLISKIEFIKVPKIDVLKWQIPIFKCFKDSASKGELVKLYSLRKFVVCGIFAI